MFRNARQEEGKIISRFPARVTRYFGRWIEIAEAEDDFTRLKDRTKAEQFLGICSDRLALFL